MRPRPPSARTAPRGRIAPAHWLAPALRAGRRCKLLAVNGTVLHKGAELKELANLMTSDSNVLVFVRAHTEAATGPEEADALSQSKVERSRMLSRQASMSRQAS